MKRAAEIIEYLSRPNAPHAVLLAPNAPPVTRSYRGIDVALNVVMDAGDIYDTLKAFLAQAGLHAEEPVRESGTFSFSVPAVGRFRVHYATQRGSKVARISVIPYTIPALSRLCVDPQASQRGLAALGAGRPGLIAVCGPDAFSNNTFIYALIRELNQNRRYVIYVIERALTFLVSHGESIVIQTELGSDTDTLEKGLSNAFMFDPNVVFVGDIRATDAIPSLVHAVGSGVLTLVSSVSIRAESLLAHYLPPQPDGAAATADVLRCGIHVTPQDDGRLDVIWRDYGPEDLKRA